LKLRNTPLISPALYRVDARIPAKTTQTRGGEMHLHLVRVAPRPTQAVARPAKVVALDSRRKARLEAARQRERQRPRPAA
jgi:hypothetical protein